MAATRARAKRLHHGSVTARTNHLLGGEFGPSRFETHPVAATVTKRWRETAGLGNPVGPGMPRFTAFLLVLLVALPLLLTACGKGGGGY